MLTKPKRTDYEFLGCLHQGQFTNVHLARIKNNPERQVVIKQTLFMIQGKCSEVIKNIAKNEIEILKKVKNSNVVAYIDHFEDVNSIYLVEEFCNGKHLGILLNEKIRLKEQEVIAIVKQILNGLQGLHYYGLLHRDLTIKNILVHDVGEFVKISGLTMAKLLSERINKNILLTQSKFQIEYFYDSLDNIAPEVIEFQQYGLQADIFSIGCIFYQLIIGKLPFSTSSKGEYIMAIKQGIKWPEQEYVKITDNCKKLIEDMLKYNPNERINFSQIYVHSFFLDQNWSNIGVENSFLIQASQIKFGDNQKFYLEKSKEIDKVILENSQYLQQELQKVTFPQCELVISYKDIMLKETQQQLKRVTYFANTIFEISTINIRFPLEISYMLTSKVYKESLRILKEINDTFSDQNEQNDLKTKLKDQVENSERQLEEFKKHIKNKSILEQTSSIRQENLNLLERGLEFLLTLKRSETMRVHNHLIKCIKNRDLQNAKFEPNLDAEFDGQGTTLMTINVGDLLE